MDSIVFQSVIIGAGTIVLGLGTWLTVMVFKISVNSSVFPTELKALREAFNKLETALTLLAAERKVIDEHGHCLEDISKKVHTQGKSIKGVERFLGDKHGSEFYAVYEKYQDTNS